MRKPDLSFYRHVLEEVKLAPKEVVFIDGKTENVLAAKSLGINSIVLDDKSTVSRSLTSYFRWSSRKGLPLSSP